MAPVLLFNVTRVNMRIKQAKYYIVFSLISSLVCAEKKVNHRNIDLDIESKEMAFIWELDGYSETSLLNLEIDYSVNDWNFSLNSTNIPLYGSSTLDSYIGVTKKFDYFSVGSQIGTIGNSLHSFNYVQLTYDNAYFGVYQANKNLAGVSTVDFMVGYSFRILHIEIDIDYLNGRNNVGGFSTTVSYQGKNYSPYVGFVNPSLGGGASIIGVIIPLE